MLLVITEFFLFFLSLCDKESCIMKLSKQINLLYEEQPHQKLSNWYPFLLTLIPYKKIWPQTYSLNYPSTYLIPSNILDILFNLTRPSKTNILFRQLKKRKLRPAMNWEKDDGKNLALIFVLSTNRIQFRIIFFFLELAFTVVNSFLRHWGWFHFRSVNWRINYASV